MFFKAYITDAIRQISENTAKQSNGVYPEKRYIDLLNEYQKEKNGVQQKTGDQVLAETIAKLGLHKAE